MMNIRLLQVLGMMIVGASLLGCGVKGDLYWPKENPSNAQTQKSAENT